MGGWRGPQVEGERPTLGWIAIDWIEENCVVPDGVFAGEPFKLTNDDGSPTVQGLWVLGFYELREDATVDFRKPSRAFVHTRGGQLVAPQKWGKGPLSAAVILFEAYGPCLFDGWDENGEPTGRAWATPWIQVTAISEDQTGNIWRALIPMIQLGGLTAEIPDTGETRINLPNGGRIEPVTASARSRLGQRVTFVVQDEAHDWTKQNKGRKLADTQRRNLAGMGGRFMETGNAWDPNEKSVAQQTYEKEKNVFKIMLEPGKGSIKNMRDRMAVLKRLYAGNPWVDVERISEEIDTLIERGEYAQAERYFFNRVIPGEDRAFDMEKWNSLANRRTIADGEQIVIGVDGARYVDALAVVATHVKSGYQWPLGIWERPETAPEDYEHPMEDVDGVVIGAFEQYNVWRVYIDPGSQYANITPLMEKWQGRWGEKRIIRWQMNRPTPTAYMIRNYISGIMTGDLSHPGDEKFTEHISNARRQLVHVYDEEKQQMFVLQKETPHSPFKIDAAAAGALSWQARGDAIAAGRVAPGPYEDAKNRCARCKHLRRHHSPKCRARPEGHCPAFVEPTLEDE